MQPEAEDTQSIPPRYWWLKRLLIAGVGLLVVLAAIWAGWDYVARRALQAEIDKLIAAGEPVYQRDFTQPNLADDQNAYILFKAAVAKLNALPPADRKRFESLHGCPADIDQPREAERLNRATSEIRSILRRAGAMDRAVWPSHERLRIPLSKAHSVIGLAGALAHREGNDQEAVACVRDLLRLGCHIDASIGLLGHLVSIGYQRTAISFLEWMTPDLKPGGTGPNALPRAEGTSLIAQLLNEDATNQGMLRSMYGERAVFINILCMLGDNQSRMSNPLGGDPVWGFLMQPSLHCQRREVLEALNRYVNAARATNYPAVVRLLPSRVRPTHQSRLELTSKFLLPWGLPDFSRTFERHWNTIANRRMAATALAVRLYQIDHGRFPAKLVELVPGYLPSVSSDPMASTPRPFVYEPGGTYPCLRAADDSRFYLKGRPPEPAKKGTRRATTAPGTSTSR